MFAAIKKQIPNLFTLGNLSCGVIAIILISDSQFERAAWFMLLATVLDFFDGFLARLFKVSGEMGKQLDSLADLVTFGIAPAIMLYVFGIHNHLGPEKFAFILLAVFSAYRLARFNIDTRQSTSFIGVPTPITGTNDTGTYTSDTITIQTAGACAATLANTPVSATTYSIQTGAGGQPAFFVKNDTIVNGVVTSGTAQELVEGIENMQIFYGVDTNTPHDGANYYVSANQVTTSAWPNVISVRISLLAASDDNLSSQAVDYTYNSTTATTPTDLKIRRVFNATIAIRNRM